MNSRASRRKIFLNVRIKHGLKKYLYEIALCIMCSYCDRFLVLKDVLKKNHNCTCMGSRVRHVKYEWTGNWWDTGIFLVMMYVINLIKIGTFNYLNLTPKYSVCHCSWFISYYVKIWFRQRYITQNHCIHVRSFQCISASQPANSIAYRFARCEFLIFFRFLSELNVA